MQDYDKLTKQLTELEQRVVTLEKTLASQPHTTTETTSPKQRSLREVINELKPVTANDKALTIAYYFETYKGQKSFNAEDIKNGFKEARIIAPKNPNDVINKNIAKAFMMDADEKIGGKMSWMLTATGLEVVEKGFNKEK
jgi:uncharacterized coiled-coil protein SlyX